MGRPEVELQAYNPPSGDPERAAKLVAGRFVFTLSINDVRRLKAQAGEIGSQYEADSLAGGAPCL